MQRGTLCANTMPLLLPGEELRFNKQAAFVTTRRYNSGISGKLVGCRTKKFQDLSLSLVSYTVIVGVGDEENSRSISVAGFIQHSDRWCWSPEMWSRC